MHFTDPGRIRVFLRDTHKKNFLTIGKEVLTLWALKKEIPLYYFKHLYKKHVPNYRDFLSPGEVNRIKNSSRLHKSEYTSLLHNKLSFALYCDKNGLPSPRLISHNFDTHFFYEGEQYPVDDLVTAVSFFSRVFEAEEVTALFFRPLALNGGQGCFRLDRDHFERQLEAELDTLLQGDYTHTEVITQHPGIDRIYAKSINTLRILTFIENDKVEIISVFMRIGAGGSIVDNGSSGGVFVGIDLETGRMQSIAHRDLKFGGGEFHRHPDTDFEFNNFEVPLFKEACELAKEAARGIPNRFIGWDIALGADGPLVIEGNEDPHLFMSDVAYGGLLQNEIMQRVLDAV